MYVYYFDLQEDVPLNSFFFVVVQYVTDWSHRKTVVIFPHESFGHLDTFIASATTMSILLVVPGFFGGGEKMPYLDVPGS